jgi:hypothetical protein
MFDKILFWINFLPDYVFYITIGIGLALFIVSYILKLLPPLRLYIIPIQILSLLIIASGIYFTGSRITQKLWEAKVKELTEKVTELENRGEKITTVVQERVVKKLEIVRIPGNEIVKYVDREIVKYDNKCDIPNEVIKAHNAAAQNKLVEDKK